MSGAEGEGDGPSLIDGQTRTTTESDMLTRCAVAYSINPEEKKKKCRGVDPTSHGACSLLDVLLDPNSVRGVAALGLVV
jgi:hypothetical protein